MKTMKDSRGHEVPVKYINKYDKARDAASRKVLARFCDMRKKLEKLVKETLDDLDTVRSAADSGREWGEKGNYQITSFDGLIKVEIRQSYRIMLDERVIKARELMFDYAKTIAGKVGGTDGAALLEIIRGAFEANRAGALPYAKVLALLRLNITAKEWLEAKALLTESIKPEKGKCYLNCAIKPDIQHDFKTIRLDLADCWPIEE